MINQAFDKIKNIHNLSELRLPMLFLGLAMWVAAPVIGNIPILLSIQLSLLSDKKTKQDTLLINNILLVLVVISSSIYISSFDIFADTKVYLNAYDSLDVKGIFDNEFARDRYEFVLFLLLYPIHILTNGSEYLCLLIFSLIINFTVVFYISKNLSSKYYPTLLIVVFSTFFYYSQVFYMRQFLAITLVMMGVIALDSSLILFFIWSLLAIFSHTSSVIYVAICLGSKFVFFLKENIKIKLRSTDKVLLYIGLIFLLGFIFYIGWIIYNNPQEIYSYANNVIDLLPEKRLSSSIQGRVDSYDGRDTDLFEFNIFRIVAVATIGIFVLIKRYRNLTPKLLSLNIFFIVSLLQIAFIMVTGFNQRIVYLFLVYYGFFLCIGLNEKEKIKPFGIISLLTMFVAAANTFNLLTIQVTMIDSKGWSFFDGQPLAMSIYDYIVYFFQSI